MRVYSIRDIEQQAEDKKLNEYLDTLDRAELEDEAQEDVEAEAEEDERQEP